MSKMAEANGMMEQEYRRRLHKCWAEASSQLRALHDAEFHEILAERYASMELIVAKRPSRATYKQAEYERALRLIEAQGRTVS
jgi:hypothetical protein